MNDYELDKVKVILSYTNVDGAPVDFSASIPRLALNELIEQMKEMAEESSVGAHRDAIDTKALADEAEHEWNIDALRVGETLVKELFPGETLGSITVDQFAIMRVEYYRRLQGADIHHAIWLPMPTDDDTRY